MVADVADAKKLVTELQAANAALKAKVERLQREGHMEQGRGSCSGLGDAPGMWQVGRGLQDDRLRMVVGCTCQMEQAGIIRRC